MAAFYPFFAQKLLEMHLALPSMNMKMNNIWAPLYNTNRFTLYSSCPSDLPKEYP